MTRHFLYVLFSLALNVKLNAQSDTMLLRTGQPAPSFIVNVKENTIQSITMPYMKKIVVVHFWSSSIPKSRAYCKNLNRLSKKYSASSYKNAEGFEVISVAVQTDKNSWAEAIQHDSLKHLTHGIAIRGYNDAVCKKFGVTTLPTSYLVDEEGTILMVNPRIIDIENVLDERRNFQPIRKDIQGVLAQSSNREDPVKFSRLFLMNYYGDSITKTITGENGQFIFPDVKLSQDFVLKVDNKININTSDPIALYSPTGEFMMDGRTREEGFVFGISPRTSNKLVKDTPGVATSATIGEINVIKSLTFSSDGAWLTPKDVQELKVILQRLQKSADLKLEFYTHTDVRMDPEAALELTGRQATAIKNHFVKYGISAARIKAIAKGNSELRKRCDGTIDCREADHMINRRVEFIVYKD